MNVHLTIPQLEISEPSSHITVSKTDLVDNENILLMMCYFI